MSTREGNRARSARRPTGMRHLTDPARATRLWRLVLAGGLLVGLAACGDDTVGSEPSNTTATLPPTTAPAPFVALRHESDGGCQVLGPNCPTYVVWSDGRVELFRTGREDDGAVLTGSVPVAAVDEWLTTVRDLDAAVLADEVGPGTCNSCVDGADIVVVTATGHGDETLDSTVLAFDPEHEVFAALGELMARVDDVGPLPIVESGA